MNKKTFIYLASLFIVLGIAGLLYWYFFMNAPATTNQGQGTTETGGFQPFGRTGSGSGTASTTGSMNQPDLTNWTPGSPFHLPTLRLLSSTPVGGYGVMDNASTTVVRWVDRGRGNVYEATYDSPLINTLSNTIVPRIYASAWNADLTSFIASLFQSGDTEPSTVFASLNSQATSSDASVTPYELRGKNLPNNVITYAVSPKRDRLFMLTTDTNGNGVGYISNLDGSKTVVLFSTPLTQVNVSWPTDNAILVVTKGIASENGFAYLVNAKTGLWNRILGPLPGLSATISHDGKYAFLSASAEGGGVLSAIYSLSAGTSTDAVIKTLADKCAWGNYQKDTIYCAVPAGQTTSTYPDDWYTGKSSGIDKIWQVDAPTGRVTLVTSLVDHADRIIDAFNLSLDAKDHYLFFMNKNDLSLWSLDLSASGNN